MADFQNEGSHAHPTELNTPVRFNATKFLGEVAPSRASSTNANPTFSGSYTGPGMARLRVTIATAAAPDTFNWDILHADGETLAAATAVAVDGTAQTLAYGLTVTFPSTTGYSVGDSWQVSAASDALQARSDVEGAPAFEIRGSQMQDAQAAEPAHELRTFATSATQIGRVVFRKARGTRSAPTIVSNADDLGAIDWRGYDGSAADGTAESSWPVAARILVEVGAAPGAGDMAGRMLFQVTADGSVTPATALTIEPTGAITIGALAVTSLDVGGGYAAGSGATLDALGNVSINGDMIIDGDLTVSGDTVQQDVATLTVEDPLIELARSNAADALDQGFYGNYNDGTARFIGLFRDVTDGRFKLFDGLTVEPTTTVDTGGVGYDHADLQLGALFVDDATSLGGNVTFLAGGNRVIGIAAEAADTAGRALAIASGPGGAAVAAAGGLGGAASYAAGAGGAGAAAQLAGAGGALTLAGGAAGADGGGGGANGGNLVLRGGNASAAGTDGAVLIGDANTSAVTVTPATTFSAAADFDAGQTLAANQSILGDGNLTVGVVDGAFNLVLQTGDNAGVQGVSFEDSDDAQVAFLDSNGTLRLAAGQALDTLAAGALNIGPTNATSVLVTPATTFTATADFNGGQTIAAGQSIRGDGALTVDIAPAAADAAGAALAVTGGAGGVSAAAAGGLGGANTFSAGAGGAGGAAQLAGAGGSAVVRGGDAGADGGGGGAAGGNLALRGGNASGAAADGVVSLGDLNTLRVDIYNVSDVAAAVGADSFAFYDATDGIIRRDLISDVVTAMAGVGLAASAGVLTLDFSELPGAVIDVAADSIPFMDADAANAGRMESVADLVGFMAGVGLSATTGVLALALSEVTGAAISEASDSIVFLDATDSTTKLESVADLATAMAGAGLVAASGKFDLSLIELTEAVVDAAADSIAFIDANDTNASRRESIADLASAMANGTTITSSAGVHSVGTQSLGSQQVANVADEGVGIPICYKLVLPAGVTGDVTFTPTPKFQITEIVLHKTLGAGVGAGSWQLRTAAGGAGTAITDAIATNIADDTVVRVATLDDSVSELAAATAVYWRRTRVTSNEDMVAYVFGIRRA